MMEIAEALALVLSHAATKSTVRVKTVDAVGMVLAADVASDVDSPPHDKAMVDGYAVRAGDVTPAASELTVIEEVTAGDVPQREVSSGTATRIMTGAPVPAGADAVVMIERTELIAVDGGNPCVRVHENQIRPGQNIMLRATSMARGDVVLRAGRELQPIDVGLLAEVGRAEITAVTRPALCVLATGNELVPAHEIPAAGQIRNSNGPMLSALAARAGATVVDLGIARDDESELSRLVQQGLAADVLVLSGGVSAGVLDLVPSVLARCGVVQIFHKVNLKPGKPVWFGITSGRPPKLVFGLPGNPVSSLVCFELFVRPALAALAGKQLRGTHQISARLAREHHQRGDRVTYWPAVLRDSGGDREVEPLAWQGSADLRTLVDANCLIHFPAGDRKFDVGEQVSVDLLS